ncbi:MAG TPA: helix-turn-helix domain-containing protein [Candidatus Nanoarchaeia archaeon]|nr:helix-turn-helix domain-containing protein [Candidatus Nanoarchaeia archaeon]
MIEENLSELGFSPSEIKIYLHLLRNGSSYPNKISAEKKLNRTNVYEALDRLISKGVVSFINKNKVKWFEAKSPDSLLSLIKEKEDEFKTAKNKILEDIKTLNQTKSDANPLEANVFTGRKGLRMIFEDILETKKPISLIAAELQFREFFGPYFELWHKERIERKISQRTIFSRKFKGKLENRKFLEYKFVDNKYTNPTTTILYGDYCIFIQWSKEPIAIKIQNKDLAKSHLNYFNMLWNS